MRIAISGTHCCGKTTLIQEFLLRHKGFTFEAEPYEILQDEYGELFAADPSAGDFQRQLEYCVDRLDEYKNSNDVIFERCPADYLAYLFALGDLRRDSQASQIAAESLRIVRAGMKNLDIVVLLRLEDQDFDISDEEDPELRTFVDAKLESILIDNELDLLPDHLSIVESSGSTNQRLQSLEVQLRRSD